MDFSGHIDPKEYDDLNNVLDGLETFQTKSMFGEIKDSTINSGINSFLNLTNAKSISIYLMNNETFEFEHRNTKPIDEEKESKQIFHKCTEKGFVGKILNTNDILTYEDLDEYDDHNIILVPLIGQYGIVGILLIVLNEPLNENLQSLKSVIKIQSRYMSFAIENDKVYKELESLKNTMEQKISSRLLEVSRSKREINAILDSIQTGLIIVNSENSKILRVNPVAEKMIGDKEENLIGKSIARFLEESNQIINNNYESFLYNKNSDKIPIFRKNTILDVGENKMKIESFQDISEMKEAQNVLSDSNKVLEDKVKERTQELEKIVYKLEKEILERKRAMYEAQREKEIHDIKSKFIAMVSHEFRTPLTVIRSGAEIIKNYRDKMDEAQMSKYLTRIEQTVDYMSQILQNVLQIDESEEIILSGEVAGEDLVSLTTQAIEYTQANSKSYRQILFTPDDDRIRAKISPKLFKHILVNVLSNADKFSPSDQPIELILSKFEDEVDIVVRDYGIGIPEDEISKVYDLFFRGSNVENIQGVGIGMSVVKQCINLLEGQIEINSTVGSGTEVKITIPEMKPSI